MSGLMTAPARSAGHAAAFENRRTIRCAINQEFADPSALVNAGSSVRKVSAVRGFSAVERRAIGALLGGFLGQLVSAAFMHGEPQPAIVSIAALVGGGAALIFRKLRIMATISATAMCGAGCMVFGILIFVLTKSAGPIANFDLFSRHGKFAGYSLLLGWIALSIVGVMVQYRLLPDPEKKAVEKQMDSAATSWDGDSSKV